MQKILVLRGGALGDFIVTLPALALLRKNFPAAQIELAGNPTAAAIAFDARLPDRVHSQHAARWSALFDDAPLAADFTRELAAFDLVLNFWPDPDGALSRHFPLRRGQIFLTAPALPTRAPAAAHYCEPLRALGLVPRDFFFRLATPAATANAIAIHPGSGSPKKNWPAARWREVIAGLPAPVLLITGEAEPAEWNELASARVSLAANLPLRELVTAFSRCRLFLGHDSGISHLAAACGVPSVLLFGPTDPAMWAPPAPHVRVIQRGPELSAISISDVQRQIESALRARP